MGMNAMARGSSGTATSAYPTFSEMDNLLKNL
jgi:hypothetical protein